VTAVRLISGGDLSFTTNQLPGATGSDIASVAAAEAATDGLSVDVFRIAGTGTIPEHAGRRDQLCVVLSGDGWAAGADGRRSPIRPGDVVCWRQGEQRSLGSDTGVLLLSVRSSFTVLAPGDPA
jgi:uncharacterized cupin superfamily protein